MARTRSAPKAEELRCGSVLSFEPRRSEVPAKLAQALLAIVDEEQPPFRFIAGADAIAQAEAKLAERQQQIDAFRDLSTSLALDEAVTAA